MRKNSLNWKIATGKYRKWKRGQTTQKQTNTHNSKTALDFWPAIRGVRWILLQCYWIWPLLCGSQPPRQFSTAVLYDRCPSPDLGNWLKPCRVDLQVVWWAEPLFPRDCVYFRTSPFNVLVCLFPSLTQNWALQVYLVMSVWFQLISIVGGVHSF